MISLLFLVSALALGTSIIRRLGLRLLPFETPALAAILGLLLWNWLAFLLALLMPYAASLPLTVILAAGISAWLWRGAPAWHRLKLPGGRPAWIAWGAFTAFTLLLMVPLMWTHFLPQTTDGIFSANSAWADFGVHASIINHFAVADRLPMDLPVAAGTALTYPFMVNLLSAWFVYGGWSLHAAILVPSLLLFIAFIQLMMGFGVRLFGRLGGSIIGLTLALLSGSAVGIFTAYKDYQASGYSLGQFLNNLPKDYTVLSEPNAQVISFVADILLPQRGFLMGCAVFAAVLVLFTMIRKGASRPLAWFTGAVVGLLPFVHAHTFLVLGVLTAALWLDEFLRSRKITNSWLIIGLTALAVALPQLLWQMLANGNGSGGHFSPGWTINPGEPILSFWAHNFGLMALFIVGLAVVLATQATLRHYLVWYLPFLVVFITANIYSFQSFAFDNGKLIMYVYLICDLFIGYLAIWLVRRNQASLVPLALIGVLLCGSGALAITREFQQRHQFASNDDIALAAWVKSSTASSDVFMATDRPNQPIATLAGRSLVSGYRGWLYSYHIPYQDRLEAIGQGLRGELKAPVPYDAKYLAISAYEPSEWVVDRPALDSAYERVYSNASWTVYRLP